MLEEDSVECNTTNRNKNIAFVFWILIEELKSF